MDLRVPETARVLVGQDVPAVEDADSAVTEALRAPISSAPLAELIARKNPKTLAITISDITRPVPNKQFLPAILRVLNEGGLTDSQIVIIIGTGMHRPSTPEEREVLLGNEILSRIEVIDHDAHDPATLAKVSDDPPVFLCRRFADADFRVVTGYIEAHFMAGFSGGRKGVCPALVDLKTIQKFHGYETLAHPRACNGVLEGNPCHEIALKVAKTVAVDFLFNVAITRDWQIAGIYCGDLEDAHIAGCKQVTDWTTAEFEGEFDLVITNGGGYPLDETFYQVNKGMCTALPCVSDHTTVLIAADCGEQLGSDAFTQLLLKWENDWKGFLDDIRANSDVTQLDQWAYHMQTKLL